MGLLDSIFGSGSRRAREARDSRSPRSVAASSMHSTSAASGFASSSLMPGASMDARQQFTVRRDLLRVVLRDTLTRNGIPAPWVEVQALNATSGGRSTGLLARFHVRHWHPQLLAHAPALERLFIQRLMALDPLADQWLTGMSWQLDLPDDLAFDPLPRPSFWTSHAHPAAASSSAARAEEGADVIAGPVRIRTGSDHTGDAKADLERLLADGDADAARGAGSFASTQPSPLR